MAGVPGSHHSGTDQHAYLGERGIHDFDQLRYLLDDVEPAFSGSNNLATVGLDHLPRHLDLELRWGSYRVGGVILERRSPSCRRWHKALLF